MRFEDREYLSKLEEYFQSKAREHRRCGGCEECRKISEIETEQVRRALRIDE